MKRIDLTNKQYDQLRFVIFGEDTWHQEATLYSNPANEEELLKIYNLSYSHKYINKKIQSINNLMHFKRETDIQNLLIPTAAVYVENQFRGIAIPKIHGSNASVYLTSKDIPLSLKIEILKQIGTILKDVRTLGLKTNAYADVHGDNFMVEGINLVNPELSNPRTIGIDTDSMKLYDSPGITNFYLYNNGNIYDIKKYESNDFGMIKPDPNTDIFCFIMMILELISNEEFFYTIDINEFNYYLDYLDKLGLNSKLLESFASIYQNTTPNLDPLPYLDSIKTLNKDTSLHTFRRTLI